MSIIIMGTRRNYMGIILEFPHKERRNQIEVEKEIYNLAEHLKDLYDAIRKVELGQEQLKKQACDMEDTYQTLIQLYGELVGNENVPADMLEYAIFVGMTRDPKTGKITITFEPPPPDGAA